MAFRVCSRAVRTWVRVSGGSGPAGGRDASLCLRTGRAAHGRPTTGCSFTPVCFITSDAFLNRLAKGKVAELDDSGYPHPCSLPPDGGKQLSLLLRPPDQPETSKVLKVAVVGSPNAGKSTLSNQLLGRKVFAVSNKVHTTRSKTLGVLTEDDTQIVLLDTPGLTTKSKVKRHNLEMSLLSDPWSTVKEADLLLVMVDVADKWACEKLDFEVLKVLTQHPEVPAVLVLNKTDLVKDKSKLLDVTALLTCGVVNGQKMKVRSAVRQPRAGRRPPVGDAPRPPTESAPPDGQQPGALKSQQGWPHFRDVFMVSSVDPEDVGTLKRYLVVEAKPGPWEYHSEVLTDQTPEEVCVNIVRAKLLEYLHQEVPYTMTQSIEFWRENENGELDISVKLHAKKEAHMASQMVARIAREAGEDMSSLFLKEVKLRLSVKLKD
ncbi:GTPase Era, mitochondrial [Merluccius polli]|uniref:GTPase Era, mitochondrial n=1 Tax=Merluccius polli TaxID=89951 RepID=A0AA47NTD6_MERPO|nr:GTPase Era, mitochondrial [Merluccius polli]